MHICCRQERATASQWLPLDDDSASPIGAVQGTLNSGALHWYEVHTVPSGGGQKSKTGLPEGNCQSLAVIAVPGGMHERKCMCAHECMNASGR